MSSEGKRERELPHYGVVSIIESPKTNGFDTPVQGKLLSGKQMTVSESHRMDRSTGSYRSGGPFYTSRWNPFYKPSSVKNAFALARDRFYSGPVIGSLPSEKEMKDVGFKNVSKAYGDKNESQMLTAGTNAISYVNPTNPASNLGTTLAETMREGIPSLPGIKLWKGKTAALKAAGDEYLNYQFGWAPLVSEVGNVSSAARLQRDIMKQYHKDEGSNTHRRFDYPSDRFTNSITIPDWYPETPGNKYYSFWTPGTGKGPVRTISLVRETKRWFEGVFTYGLPSSTDNWRKAMGFGSDADKLFGIALSPEILWELTPWSWAVDWFSNAGEVINNVTRFGLAGCVLRYGYIMEESIETVTATGTNLNAFGTPVDKPRSKYFEIPVGGWSCGFESVTKRRAPASPFGFSIGWEGLSPTQLAITAALGITKVL